MALLGSLRAVAKRSSARGKVAPLKLEPIDIEEVRFPGEIEAAGRVRKIKGFKRKVKQIELDDALDPGRVTRLDELMVLDEQTAPEFFATLKEVVAALRFPWAIEAYQDTGSINAGMEPGKQGAVLTLEGPVLSLLSASELRGLLGHELSHYMCHSGPGAAVRRENRVSLRWRSYGTGSDEDRAKTLAASALLVAEEITADRFELLVSQDFGVYLSTSLKMSTELHDSVVQYDPGVLLRQAREALSLSVGKIDTQGSHPERHLRVRAAELFHESDLFKRLTGKGPGKRKIADVNLEIARLLSGWVPRGADRIDQAKFEQFLLAMGRAIVSADGVFRRGERRFLSLALPGAWRGRMLSEQESDELVDGFAAELRSSGDQRALLTTLNFLCNLVEADGQVDEAELRAIDELGKQLGARDLFRHELDERFDHDPSRAGEAERRDDAVAEATPSLERYLDTVVAAGERRTTLARLLSLGCYPSGSRASRARLAAVLDASGVVASPPVQKARLEAPLRLRRDDPPARPR